MRTTKRGKVAALATGLALAAGTAAFTGTASATTPPTSGGTTAATAGTTAGTSAPAGTAAPAGTTAGTAAGSGETLPPSTGNDQVTYAQEEEGTQYNNSNGSNNSFANTVVNNMLQPGPFILNDKLGFDLWTDFVTEANVLSTAPQVIEYKLNPAAVWSDGAPLDCNDFYLLWLAQIGKVEIANPDFAPGKTDESGNPLPEKLPLFDIASSTGYEQIKSVDCSNPTDVKVTFDPAFADWKGLFGGMIPAHVVEKMSGVADMTKVDPTTESDDLKKIAEVWNNGLKGWNPDEALSGAWYKIQQYTEGQGIVLVKNDKFWGKAANINTLTLKTVNDATAQATALQNNELQAIQPQADPGVADQLRGAQGVTFAPAAGLTFEHLDLNAKNPLFQDAAVRKAFAQCVDRQDIIDKLVAPIYPDSKPLNSVIFMPVQNGYQDDFTTQFDVAAAKATLEAGGWKAGADGVMEKDGKKLAFRISHKGIQRRSDTTQNIIASCKQAGFDISEDSDKKFNAERLPKGDFDVALFAWVGNPLLSSSTSLYSAGGGANYFAYDNPKIADMYAQANTNLDEASRITQMQAIDKQIMDDMFTVPLFQLPEMPAWVSNLQGPVFNGPLGLTWNSNVWTYS